MAITATQLTAGEDSTDLSSYVSASITPTANTLVLAVVTNRSAGAEEVPTVSGCGLTWVQVASADDGASVVRTTVFRAMGATPSAGAVTFAFSATQTAVVWSIAEFPGTDTSGTDGSGAVVQSITAGGVAAGGTAGTADFTNAFGDAVNNATYSAVAKTNTQNTVVEAGFTELSDTTTLTPTTSLQIMWKVGEDQTPAPTWASGAEWAQVAIEIKAAAAGAQSLTGSLFTNAPTFFTGAVTAAYSLTGSLFVKAPTFPTGVVTPGVVTLTGTLFTTAPTFPTGAVSLTSGPQTLTGTLFTNTPTFPTGVITTGGVSLTGVLFQNTPTFPTGTVTAGVVTLTGVLFQKAPTFPTGTIGQAGTIFGTLYVNTPVFFTGSLAQGGPSFWTPNPAVYVGVTRYGPSPWGAELSGQRFEKAPTFPVGAVS